MKLDTGEIRYFTTREAATLQTFPRHWAFDPTWSRAMMEIGNAVPPLLAQLLGAAVRRALDAAAVPHAPAAPHTTEVAWRTLTELEGTALERVARLVRARLDSFARPAPLLRSPAAKVGDMEPVRVLAQGTAAPTPQCAPMTAIELWARATSAVDALGRALREKIAELQAQATKQSVWLAAELEGWLVGLKPPVLGEIDASVMALACRPTDPQLAGIPFPAYTRPVTTPPLPKLPGRELAAPGAIPGWATHWRHAFSVEAHAATLEWFLKLRDCMRKFLQGTTGDALWRLLPKSLAFGIEHFQPWLARLVADGNVVVRRNGRFEVVDQSKPPPTQLNRTYIEGLLKENGSTDYALRDALLTHGFAYMTHLRPQIVLQTPLRSLFNSVKAFISLHAEVLRMGGNGWFTMVNMSELDEGEFELCSCPGRYDPTGGVPRACEERERPIKDCGAPHRRLLCLAPPVPPLHSISGGGRTPVRSVNGSSGVRESKAEVKAMLAAAAPRPACQRHTPGARRALEPYGERCTVEIGLAPAKVQEAGPKESHSWAGGRWLWPPELKPFFIDVMLATCILGYAAELCGQDLYVVSDDIKDMFHTFPLATLQCWTMGLLRLDPYNLTEETVDAALCAVQARVLEMGVAPSSNWAQRFLTEVNHAFSKRFAAANESLLQGLEADHPKFAAWRAARRALAATTGRNEAVGHWISGYTDDIIALVIGVASTVLFLCLHAEHFGPRGLNMRMAIPAKRCLGVGAKFIGGSILTVGALAYVTPDKVLRTDGSLQRAIEGQLTVADWTKLVGLLNHLVCILLMPYYIMYDVYDVSDACRLAKLSLDDMIVTTPKGVKALRKWLKQLRGVAGTSALAAAVTVRRVASAGVVHAMRSDAAILGTAWPALCGNLYGKVYIFKLEPHHLHMPIVVLEFLGGLINMIVFGPELRGAPCALLLDALVVPLVMAGKASAPMMKFLHKAFVELLENLGLNLTVAHESGPFNMVTDCGSRGKVEEMEAVLAGLQLTAEYMDVPETAVVLVEDTYKEWLRLDEAERQAALSEPAEIEARRRHSTQGGGSWRPPTPLPRRAEAAPPAQPDQVRAVTEDERQTGRSRLNTESSGLSPYSSTRTPRAAAVAASIKLSDDLELERRGERVDERAHEAASRARQQRAAQPKLVELQGAAVTPGELTEVEGITFWGRTRAEAAQGGLVASADGGQKAAEPAPPAAPAQERPTSEEERQVGRQRLNSDSSGLSPYSSASGEEEWALGVGGRRVRQRAGAREAPADAFADAAALVEGAQQRHNVAAQVEALAAAQTGDASAPNALAAPAGMLGEPAGGFVAPSYTPAGLAAVAEGPTQRVGLTSSGPTSEAAEGAAVEVVTLPRGPAAGQHAASLAPSGSEAPTSAAPAPTRRRRRQRCGRCEGCLREECGTCIYCRDMPKRGGPGAMRRACLARACLLMMATAGEAFKLHAGPSPVAVAMPLGFAAGVGAAPTAREFLLRRAGVAAGIEPPSAVAQAGAGHAQATLAQARGLEGDGGLLGASLERAPSSARDFLMARAAISKELVGRDAVSETWAPRGTPGMHLGDQGGPRAQWRREAGLAVLPGEPHRREALAGRIHEALSHGYAPSTRDLDKGYWKSWVRFCESVGTTPKRTDMAANSGQDAEGHQEEVFLLASAMLSYYEHMVPRRRSKPAGDPRSAKKYIESVARTHLTFGIKMVSMEVVALACKGMCREYIDKHGVEGLVPERKLPFTQNMVKDMFLTPDGSSFRGLTLDWNSYYWTAVDACFEMLAEEGSRKDEVAKKTAATPFRKGRFTFASLVWHINGKDLRRPPTREELMTLRPGDGVLLKHGISKNDPFGTYFAATPSFLAYREGNERCACKALARLEIAAEIAPTRRAETPLFGPRPGEEFTHEQLDHALQLLLTQGAKVPESELQNYSVHSFRIFAACALLAAGCPRWLIKRLLRWRGEESLEVYARVNNSDWAEWTSRLLDVSVESSIASRLTYMDFSEETKARFNAVAQSLLSMGQGRRSTAIQL